MSTSFISHSPSPSAHSRLHVYGDGGDASVAESYPSRCASPLLPMGQYYHRRTPSSSHHQTVDPDRLSQQLGKVTNRQSQQSVVNKNYAIPEENDFIEPPPTLGKRNNQATRFINYHRAPTSASSSSRRANTGVLSHPTKSYRISTTAVEHHQSSVRDLSSKLKSACRKLNPKRLTKHGHQDAEEPPLPDLPHAQVFAGGGNIPTL